MRNPIKAPALRAGASKPAARAFRARAGMVFALAACAGLVLAGAGLLPGCAKPAPVLVAMEPPSGSTDVDLSVTRVRLIFDQPMSQSAAGLASIEPQLPGGWYVEDRAVTFNLIEPLVAGTTYKVTLKAGATSRDGVASTSSGTWSFTARPPAGGHTPVLVALSPLEAFPGLKALAFGANGELYAASDSEVRVLGAADGSFQPLSGGWVSIEDVDVDPAGRLWLLLAEKDNYRAVRLAEPVQDGRSQGQLGADLTVPIGQPTYPQGQWNWFYPKCLAVLPGGDLLVLGTDRVMRLGQDGGTKAELGVGTLGGSCTEFYVGPAGLVVEGDTVYVENGKGSAQTRGVVALGLDGSEPKVYRFGVGRNSGLARDSWGNCYTIRRDPAERVNLAIYGPEGDPLGAGPPASEGGLDPQATPGEILVRDGVLYVAGGIEGKILRFTIQ